MPIRAAGVKCPPPAQAVCVVIALGISLISMTPSVNAVDCSTFDPSSIHALTFDVFAALMDSPDSLVTNVAAALPALSPSDVDTFVGKWLDAYGYYFGKTFNQTTQGPEPFTWVIHTSLVTILEVRFLRKQVARVFHHRVESLCVSTHTVGIRQA
jgi:hypothetical protein